VAGGSQDALIVYPTGGVPGEQFPLLSFGHGYEAGGEQLWPYYHKLLRDVAAEGFVVVAATSCPTSFCTGKMSSDMASTLQTCWANSSLHPALGLVNRSLKTGIFGHSMGAFCTTRAVVDAQASGNLGAAVYLHGGNPWPWGGAGDVEVPVFSTTGSADSTAPPLGTKIAWEEQKRAHPKVFANLAGAMHNESVTNGRLNPYVAAFFLCHLTDLHPACDSIYGNGSKSLCHSGNPALAMAECTTAA